MAATTTRQAHDKTFNASEHAALQQNFTAGALPQHFRRSMADNLYTPPHLVLLNHLPKELQPDSEGHTLWCSLEQRQQGAGAQARHVRAASSSGGSSSCRTLLQATLLPAASTAAAARRWHSCKAVAAFVSLTQP
jgi:hypothetical protein